MARGEPATDPSAADGSSRLLAGTPGTVRGKAARPRRRRIPRFLWVVIPAAAVAVVASLLLLQTYGYFGGRVDVTAVQLTDPLGYIDGNGTPAHENYSTTTGTTLILLVGGWDTLPTTNTSGGAPNWACIVGLTISPSGFSAQGISPPWLCIPPQNGTTFYVTVTTPAHPYTGPVTVILTTEQEQVQDE